LVIIEESPQEKNKRSSFGACGSVAASIPGSAEATRRKSFDNEKKSQSTK
jgi:hypothetical protein